MSRNGLAYQADRIEKALSALDLPTRIQGGQVAEGHIRYHLAMGSDAQMHQIRKLASQVAQEIGAYNIRVSESDGSMVLELVLGEGDGIRLFPLLEHMEKPSLLTAVIGIDQKREPVSIDFRDPEFHHLLIVGRPKSGKSEFLRTVLFAIALWNNQTQANFMAIDLSGNELTVVESLPHCLAEVATESRFAIELMHWLIDEIERREVFRIRYPELFLLVDDLDVLVEESEEHLELIGRIVEEGAGSSVHVIAATEGSSSSIPSAWSQGSRMMIAEALESSTIEPDGGNPPGYFRIGANDTRDPVRVAWMPVHDIQEAVSFIQSGKVRRGSTGDWIHWY